MMMSRSHEALVESQFGSRADAYLTSQVHAHGADLTAMTELARRQGGTRMLDLGCGGTRHRRRMVWQV